MGLLQNIYEVWTKDPYRVGPNAFKDSYLIERTYNAKTDVGFRFNYTIGCHLERVNYDEFKKGGMLDEKSQQELVDVWHTEVFHPKLDELMSFCRFIIMPSGNLPRENPCLCRIVKERGEEFIYYDHHCWDTKREIEKVPFLRNGCKIKITWLKLILDDDLLKENYDMIKLKARESIENTEAHRAAEEATVIAFLHKKSELQRTFQHVQTDNEHKSNGISVKTRLVGQAMELSWDIKKYQNSGFVLRGFRKEDGFAHDNSSWNAHGMCVVETQSNGQCVQHLDAGKEYFYTFMLTKDEPVYAEQKLLESFFCSAAVKGTKTRLADSLRFSIRVPTQMEIMQVDRMLEKVKAPPPADPKREKINRAIEELQSFVEFDENITQIGEELIKQIEKKNYSEEVRNQKIERLKALLDSMLVN